MNIKICDFFHGAASPAATPLDYVPVRVEHVKLLVLLGLLVPPLLHRGHVKLQLEGLHLIKGVVARDCRFSWALVGDLQPRGVALPLMADQGSLTVFLGFLVTVFTEVLIFGVSSAFSVFTSSFSYLPS
jgi:hypothetical protein